MKIGGPYGAYPTAGVGPTSGQDPATRAGRGPAATSTGVETTTSGPGGTVRLSAEASAPAVGRPRFDEAKVERLRQDHEQGRLQADSARIAARMLEDG